MTESDAGSVPDLPLTDPDPVNPIDEMEFDLPVPDGLTPDVIQQRLEAPSSFFHVVDDQGNATVVATDSVVDPGVVKQWDDPIELKRRGDDALDSGDAQ